MMVAPARPPIANGWQCQACGQVVGGLQPGRCPGCQRPLVAHGRLIHLTAAGTAAQPARPACARCGTPLTYHPDGRWTCPARESTRRLGQALLASERARSAPDRSRRGPWWRRVLHWLASR